MRVYELTAEDLYDSYAQGANPADLFGQSRIDLVTPLRVEEGLKQEEAYYAVDQMLAYARQRVEAQTKQSQ
jgi:hypothetical protein